MPATVVYVYVYVCITIDLISIRLVLYLLIRRSILRLIRLMLYENCYWISLVVLCCH